MASLCLVFFLCGFGCQNKPADMEAGTTCAKKVDFKHTDGTATTWLSRRTTMQAVPKTETQVREYCACMDSKLPNYDKVECLKPEIVNGKWVAANQ